MKTTAFLFCAITVAFPMSAEEYVYEGRPAAEWAQDLAKSINPEKAAHALSKLGKDAVPALIPLLKDPNPKVSGPAANALMEMPQSKEVLPSLLGLLKDDSFAVRRTAVRALGKFIDFDEARAGLKHALGDRDKAVAEAAEDVLGGIERPREEQDALWKALKHHAGSAMDALREGDRVAAGAHLQAARGIPLNDPRAKEMLHDLEKQLDMHREKTGKADLQRKEQRNQQLEIVTRQAMIQLEKGDFGRAKMMLGEAARIAPDDPRVDELRRALEKAHLGKDAKFDKQPQEFEKKKQPPAERENAQF